MLCRMGGVNVTRVQRFTMVRLWMSRASETDNGKRLAKEQKSAKCDKEQLSEADLAGNDLRKARAFFGFRIGYLWDQAMRQSST
mmetsp:Transcript_13652/g.29329  ORF Transcript_13652/g.29329 Transcript_13652/m.29329 type:complete len:84 (-) Transcript_13652:147-398(-)